MSLPRLHGTARHGRVSMVYVNPDFVPSVLTREDKVRAQIAHQRLRDACAQIDGPFQKGGFKTEMRHARH